MSHRLLTPGSLAGALASGVFAQGGGFNPGAFEKFREQLKCTFQFVTTTSCEFTECERTASTQLKPEQAKQILTVLTPPQAAQTPTGAGEFGHSEAPASVG